MSIVEDLPIMPLKSVLFPGAPTTLHIHEERYREMLDECVDGDGVFGVALLRAGQEVGGPSIPHDVGTIAHIAEVTRLHDGTSVVLAQGGRRFRIDAILQAMPIVRADVRVLDDDDAMTESDRELEEMARHMLGRLMRLVLRTMGADRPRPEVPDDPVALSYAIAANLQAPLPVQQELLEAGSVAERLEMSLPILGREVSHYRIMAAARAKLEQLGLVEEDSELPFSRS
ncbi:MAG: LON peptidase substrate-binding domain-containing protein [Armatimonadota bacterium]|nr:LON peptidase substrate-binding domain-containing protein [Armatimonadota bacterium]